MEIASPPVGQLKTKKDITIATPNWHVPACCAWLSRNVQSHVSCRMPSPPRAELHVVVQVTQVPRVVRVVREHANLQSLVPWGCRPRLVRLTNPVTPPRTDVPRRRTFRLWGVGAPLRFQPERVGVNRTKPLSQNDRGGLASSPPTTKKAAVGPGIRATQAGSYISPFRILCL